MASPFLKPPWSDCRSLCGSSQPKGMTLLECVVAMAVAAIALSGVLSALGFMVAYQEETGLAVRAALCAQEKLEELRYEVETGAAESQDSQVVLLEGPYRGMERIWNSVPIVGEPGLWRLESECAYRWRGQRKAERVVCLAVEDEG